MDKIHLSTTEEKQINLFKMMLTVHWTQACTRYHLVNAHLYNTEHEYKT